MTLMRIYCAFVLLICASAVGAEPVISPSPPAASASPAATITQSVSELSAQGAAAERSKIYRAGAAYGRWLDQVAKDSGNTFFQRAVFDRVTWMRLLSCALALVLLSLLTAWFVWIVRRRAGEIESTRYQSWLALSAAAIRKPVALFLWMCGSAFALLPIAAGIVSRPTRIFWASVLTAILYAGWIIALLWLVFRAIRAIEKRMRLWAERTRSLPAKIVVPIVGQSLRLSVPLLGIILLLPLLKLSENWTWVTQKAVGILFIVTLSFLIVHGINAMQAALLSRQRLGPARQSFRAPDLHPGIGDSQSYHHGRHNRCDRVGADAFRSSAAVRHEHPGFGWNCRHRDRLRRATDSRQRARWNSDRVDATATHR
jgi:hypothetical protein